MKMASVIAQKIRALAQQRGPQKTFCPSEAARALRPDDWRGHMPAVRQAAKQLAQAGEVRILQSGQEVDIDQAKGPIRIQLVPSAVWAQTAFITRDLKGGSPFRQQLEKAGWEVHGQSLIRFEPLAFGQLPAADWIFFYSKRAVAYFFQQLPDTDITQRAKVAAIGPGTAAALQQQGVNPSYVGNGIPEEVAQAFAAKAKGQRVLFPQARRSRQSVQKALGKQVQAQTLIIYDNKPLQDVPFSRAQVLVFTSPLSAEAYLSRHSLLQGQRVVAIGQPTAEALKPQGVNPKRADMPTEEALAKAVLNFSW